jgi:hypothetical protein
MNTEAREALQQEVELHRTRVEELDASLLDAETNLGQVVDAPPSILRQVEALKIELRGRRAALAMGCAVLESRYA